MTLAVPTFDTDAMRQIADYRPHQVAAHETDHPKPLVTVETSVWNTLIADHLAAADHIDLLEFALKQRAA